MKYRVEFYAMIWHSALMKKHYLLLSLIFILVSFSSFARRTTNCSHTATTFKCVKFLYNYDGDTLKVDIPRVNHFFGKNLGVRLNGIDTPEKRTRNLCEKELSKKAQKYLLYRILKSKSGTIELRNVKRGKYFRVVADVWVNGRNLNKAMVRKGLAVEYLGDTKAEVNWCSFNPDLPNDLDDVIERHFNSRS